jgi:RND family efflux transporter MFP subunit
MQNFRILLALCVILAPTGLLAEVFGYTEPRRTAEMAFAEGGILSEILVEEGDRVQRGDVLARLNAGVLEADLKIAKEQVGFQQLKFGQYERLRESGNASIEEFERAKSDLMIAKFQVERIQAQLDDRSLQAPFNAVVTRIHRELSENAAAQSAAMTIVELDTLQLNLNIPVQQIESFRAGKKVSLQMGEAVVPAEVEFISPTIDAASQTVRVRFIIDNSQGRYPSGLRGALIND